MTLRHERTGSEVEYDRLNGKFRVVGQKADEVKDEDYATFSTPVEEPKIPIPHVDKFKITEEVPKTQ